MYDNQTDHCPCCGYEYGDLRPLPGRCGPCAEDRAKVPAVCSSCHETH